MATRQRWTRLYARTNAGFELKVLASIIALACTNMY
jgi:hypothetical protein